jgi:hypothetical protein
VVSSIVDHTFDTVDEKVAEAELFLQKMAKVSFAPATFNSYLSAFLSACRTVTLALQQFTNIPGFLEWYEPHRDRLKTDQLAKFFLEARNDHLHGGPSVAPSASILGDDVKYFFRKSEKGYTPTVDVVTGCRNYFILLLEIVYDSYVKLGVHIDPQQYFTKEHFASEGRGIDHAEGELYGWIMSSLIEEGWDEDDRWQELRAHVDECKINHLFFSYLGKPTPQPIVSEHFEDFAYTPEERGWLYVPAGFASLEDYENSRSLLLLKL